MAKKKPESQPQWPADKVERRPIAELLAYPQNPMLHSEASIEQIAASMREFGWTVPILIDEDGMIIAGHARLLAAQLLGLLEVPVMRAIGWTEEQKRAYRIADNQLPRLAEFSPDLLKLEIGDLKLAGYDLRLLGFNPDALTAFMAEARPDADATPEPLPDPVSYRGDLWRLGEHRILCGDSMLKATWDKLCGTERAQMVFTDPPYGVSYEATSGKFDVIEGDDKRRDDLYKMLLASLRHLASRTVERAGFYIWHATATREDFSQAMKSAGLAELQYLIWVKPGIILGHSDYRWQHEPCFYASKAGAKPAFYGDRSDSTVWHVALGKDQDVAATIGNGLLILDGAGATLYLQSRAPKNKKLRQIRIVDGKRVLLTGADRQDGTVWEVARDGGHVHPTQKPVELARRAVENSSQPGELVIDAFLGSGTTLIAAQMTARRCYAVELDPTYVDVAVRRWEQFTGGQAELDGIRGFDHVAKARGTDPERRPAGAAAAAGEAAGHH